jgi:aldose 1-epimerase
MVLEIPASRYLPVDAGLIPTGEMRAVAGTPFDFRSPRAIGERVRAAADEQIRIGRGYDHNWIVTAAVTPGEHLMARVTDPASGRRMELWSDQPGLQFYSGNFLDGTTRGKSGQLYRQGDAIVLEPQVFPDAVNQPRLGNVALLPGQTYRNSMTYRFSTVSQAAADKPKAHGAQ